MCFHGPNLVSCKVITGTDVKRILVIGAYLLTPTLEHLSDLEEDLTCLWDHYLIFLSALITDIVQSQNRRSQQVSGLLMDFGLMDLLLHF